MQRDFILPDLGEGIHEAQVVNVKVKEGDAVAQDQMVLEVETDKAAVELPVPYAGVITKVNVQIGQTIKVGQVLLTVDDRSATEAAGPSAPAETPSPTTEVEVPAPPPPQYGPGPVPAAPAVRRLAREAGIDLRQVRGTGPGGRILRADLEHFLTARSAGVSAPIAAKPAAPAAVVARPAQISAPPVAPGSVRPPATAEPLPDFSQWGPIRREQVPQIRKTIARQMARAWAAIPHVTHADDADVTDLEKFRKEQGQVFAQQGAKLSLTAFIIKAVTGALQQQPKLNSSFDEASTEIIYKDYVNVGIAVDTSRGLMVPVIRNADRKGLLTISKEMKDLADRARDFRLDISEMRGGTFTITNVGALGGTFATPVINWPEVAILGMGRINQRPVVRGDAVVPRQILPLFLSFDHRIIDGADGARFLRAVIAFLENPLNLLLAS